ncbi:hypothetical protein FGG08_006519 [Glutinoglossum americanum]|uniref:FAD-binding FR-type domain-containing protein n=1 Tax=Glutinoglossum americanum TaxID=1670608 RepID=A0A9P8HSH4_9PEZI|nr:hypothetical protein FGG08_006519 [Glutinoglossum americanum]
MKFSSTLGLACLLPGLVVALVGIDTHPFSPPCAFACGRAIASNMLSCSVHDASGGHMHGGPAMTTPQCRAGDTAYLTTLAWCISTKCAQYHVPSSRLEKYWEEQCTGDPAVAPKWDYSTALHNITQPPTRELAKDDVLDFTALASGAAWDMQFRTLAFLEDEEALHARYGVAILVTGFAIPIVLTCLGYLPYMTGILERVKPYLVYPSAIGTYQVRPLPYLLGNAPTIGQSLYVALMVILNIILTAVNYRSTQPHAWYANQHQEVMAYVMYRTGTIGFALAPLVILFSCRNNILLWLSNWPHSTFMLLHRWVARIFGIQVLLHSILALALYRDTGEYPAVEKLKYWIWGAVATVAVSIMLVASGLYVRRWSYEIFLITHIVLAVLVIVGCWHHVELEFHRQWGYEMWLYAACAVWFFDRMARVLRILKIGVRRAKVANVGDGFVRVDIEGIRWGAAPGQHVYVYFPTLNPLRPWENHPFSVLPTEMLRLSNRSTSARNGDIPSEHNDAEKHGGTAVRVRTALDDNTTAGLTLFIRKSTGMTKSLKARDSLFTLLDGPYPSSPAKSVLRCDRLLLIGGGIGITGLLPWINSHSNAKLCWSVKETAECLVQAVDGALSRANEKDVRVGRRLDISALLSQEVDSGWAKIGVVVCGPGGLCDDVRAAVATTGKKGKAIFELEVEAYSW